MGIMTRLFRALELVLKLGVGLHVEDGSLDIRVHLHVFRTVGFLFLTCLIPLEFRKA